MLRPLALAALLLIALLSTLLAWGEPASPARAHSAAQSSTQAISEITAANVLTAGNLITVTTTDDEINNDGDCSLREAIQSADTDTGVDACPPGNAAGDGGDTLILLAGTYSLTSGQITLTGTITLQGNLSATTALDGNGASRVLLIEADARVNLRHLEIKNGLPPTCFACAAGAHGGGIANLGTTSIAYSSIHHNKAGLTSNEVGASGASGGGVYNSGTMTISNSTISDNAAGNSTCGQYDENTIVCGQVGLGGGISSSGPLTITNSTIAYNAVGRLFDFGQVYPGVAGGLYASGPTVVKNSILADNENGDCWTAITSLGNNIIETLENCTVNGEFFKWNAYLEPLADNGGPTPSLALAAKSPAIDAGDCTDSSGFVLSDDQRGVPRPQGGGCDIGALESPYTSTFALITTTLPIVAFDPPPCVNVAIPCNLTNHPDFDRKGAWSPDGNHIAFERSAVVFFPQGDEAGIYVMDVDGTNLSLVAPMGFEHAWSPDGTQIAYRLVISDNPEIYLVPATGGTPINLTNTPYTFEFRPDWSPDGSKIAYWVSNGDSEVQVMNADGSDKVKVGDSVGFDGWAPDSSRVALSRTTGDSFYIVEVDGSNPITFGSPSEPSYYPAWSPDGKKIAYSCHFTTPPPTIYRLCVSDSDGSNRQVFNVKDRPIYKAAWSPDGAMLAVNCGGALCTLMSDGSQLRQHSVAGLVYFQWSPLGDKILFAEMIDYSNGVYTHNHYVLNPDGSNRRQLHLFMSIYSYLGAPVWSPDGSKILYPQNINGRSDLFLRQID